MHDLERNGEATVFGAAPETDGDHHLVPGVDELLRLYPECFERFRLQRYESHHSLVPVHLARLREQARRLQHDLRVAEFLNGAARLTGRERLVKRRVAAPDELDVFPRHDRQYLAGDVPAAALRLQSHG